jgi:phosphodiesterase/alkaline phosphatase D-like protein
VPDLVLGPMLRFVGETQATIWVEVGEPARVEVLGQPATTFEVAGHHYALVVVEGLEPGATVPYQVGLNGRRVWPPTGWPFPPSVVRTQPADARRARIAFGSCRLSRPNRPPWDLPPSRDPEHSGLDALRALALRLARGGPDELPDFLLLLGDQVYADAVSPETDAFIRARRDTSQPPGDEVADFEEYTRLYRESWSEPAVRWLLSTVPTGMIFDDHEVHDDWNTSAAWVEHMVSLPWWPERHTSALASYWVYQHLGNRSPAELKADQGWERIRSAGEATELLREEVRRRRLGGWRWSWRRDLGGTRLVAIDSRCGRVLDPGRRSMVDEPTWHWLEEQVTGGVDHLLLATSLPFALPRAAHHLEAWNEAVCDGAWGGLAARAGERLRQRIDLEHWAAFHRSFNRLGGLVTEVAAGRRGPAPWSVTLLSGDVHYAYLAELHPPGRATSAVHQVVCSPFRNPLDPRLQLANRLSFTAPVTAVTAALARLARTAPDIMSWRVLRGPYFDNQIGELELDGRAARVRIERPVRGPDRPPALEPLLAEELARERR